MTLSSEDKLRLHVLLKQPLQAVRIDDSRMTVTALTADGEARVKLNPTCRDEQYLRLVRELISTEVLGSPGGYPVFMRRWTRMGQERSEESLQRLLLLGESEAAVAVVHTPELTPELARRAWWAAPSMENAQQLLCYDKIVQAPLGRELAAYIVEHLPFEPTPEGIAKAVNLVLQPDLIAAGTRQGLWQKGRRKPAYYVGFLQRQPDALPEPLPAHPQYAAVHDLARELGGQDEPALACLERVYSGQGQRFLATASAAMAKPGNQDLTVALLDAIGAYFAPLREQTELPRSIEAIEAALAQPSALAGAWAAAPEWAEPVAALRFLALVGEPLATPILALTDAEGTVLRKRLEPIFAPVLSRLQQLRGTADD
mgnify:CR=1 FL=1